ncbi:permease-like cell division protein FtsX [Candidatus Uhrbacteria bacterium]|nr:permease-like cell division protein FtsX [Candidatus Uhrbacteria bacterium]
MTMAWRIFAASWKHFARNLWIGVATVFVFTIALLSINILLGVNAVIEQVVVLLEQKVDVTVTFNPDTPEALLSQARFYVVSLPQTAEAKLVSPEEALTAFKERNKNNPKIIDALNELAANPLGAQLVIKAKHTEDYPFLLEAIRNPQYEPFIRSSSFDDHREAISRIQETGAQIRLFASALVAIFAFFGLLAAFNAIRVAIYTQREEIAIMRLVGASSSYIKLPFVLEGVWMALLSALLTAAGVWVVISILEPRLTTLFDGRDSGLSAFFFQNGTELIILQLGGLLVLSALVSWMAVGRYIRR